MSPDLGGFRERYDRAVLHRTDLAADPITQFEEWFDAWVAERSPDPTACVLATAGADGRPSARYVLCRAFDQRGFVLYTNFESHKARDIEENPWAALVFGWHVQERQVRVEGPVFVVDDDEADAYWASRPRPSRIGAWASDQSEVLEDRTELEERVRDARRRFGESEDDGPVPRPPYWGGYRIEPVIVEFWQGRVDRLHDRFRYRRAGDEEGDATEVTKAGWVIDRLAP